MRASSSWRNHFQLYAEPTLLGLIWVWSEHFFPENNEAFYDFYEIIGLNSSKYAQCRKDEPSALLRGAKYSRLSNNSRASYSIIVVNDAVSRVIRSASYSIILAVFDPARVNNFAASYSRISHGSRLRRELFDNIARLAPSLRVIRSASYSIIYCTSFCPLQ